MPFILGPLGGHTFQRTPVYIPYQRGWTARLPNANKFGQAMQKAYNHLVNWRFQGPMHLTSLPADTTYYRNEDTGTFFIPVHYPPKNDTSNDTRRIAICLRRWGSDANGAATIQFNDAGGANTTLWSQTISGAAALSEGMYAKSPQIFIAEYTPPTGLNGNGFSWIEVVTSNVFLATLGVWHLPDPGLTNAQLPMQLTDFGPGHIITADTNSVGGMMEYYGIRDAVMNEEGIERNTRRVFFNCSHPTGTQISGSTAYTNVYNDFVFSARARDLDGSNDDVECYPCFVVSTTGTGAGTNPKVRYTSGGDSWVWECPNGDLTETLIHPWSNGVSGGAGTTLDITSSADDSVTVEFSCETGQSITLHNTSLFEGPPPNWT